MTARATIAITLRRGLHSRSAAALARVAKFYRSSLLLRTLDGRTANAKSPLQVSMLKAAEGDVLRFAAAGPDEEAAVSAITNFIGGEHVSDAPGGVVVTDLVTDGTFYTVGRLLQPHTAGDHALPPAAFSDAWSAAVESGEPVPLTVGVRLYRQIGAVLPLGDPAAPAFQIIPRDDGLTRLAAHYLERPLSSVAIRVLLATDGAWQIRTVAVGSLGRAIDRDATESSDIDELARNFHQRRQVNTAPENKRSFEAFRDETVAQDLARQAERRTEANERPPAVPREHCPKPSVTQSRYVVGR